MMEHYTEQEERKHIRPSAGRKPEETAHIESLKINWPSFQEFGSDEITAEHEKYSDTVLPHEYPPKGNASEF